MPTYGYDHIHLRSADPMKTAQWYHRMLGAAIIEAPQSAGPNRVHLDINGLMVFLAGSLPPGEELQGLRDPHYGLDHFGLRVDNMDEAAVELRSRGAEFAIEPSTSPTGIKYAFLRAPDNVRIELVERPM